MTWALFEAGTVAVIAAASGIHAGAIVWGNSGQPCADPIVRLFLTHATEPVPAREVRTLTPDGHSFEVRYDFLRECTVQVRVETLSNQPGTGAAAVCDSIRSGLDLRGTLDVLELAGLVVIETLDMGDFAFQGADDRMVAAHAFDLRLRWSYSRQDPTPIGTIETVIVTGEHESPTGTQGPLTIPEPEA